MATSGGWVFDSPVKDAVSWAAFGPLPAALVGAVLLLGTAAIVVAGRGAPPGPAHDPGRGQRPGPGVLRRCPTRVHERYLFPLFGLAAILVAFSWRWRIVYAVASVATFLNMYVVLTTIYPDNPSVSDWLGIGPAIRSYSGVAIVAVMHTAAFAWAPRAAAARAHGEPSPWSWPDASRRSAPPAGAGAPTAAEHDRRCRMAAAAPPPPRRRAAATRPAATTAGAAPADAGRRPARACRRPGAACPPGTTGRPSASSGPIGWVRARMRETPIRPDRSRELAREGSAAWTAWTCGSSSCWWWHRSACAPSAWTSPPACTSTRSTTPGPPRSSSRPGATGSPTTSTSGPTRTSRSTRSRAASSPSRATTSPPRATSGCRSGAPPSSRAARTRTGPRTGPGTGCGSPPGASSSPST